MNRLFSPLKVVTTFFLISLFLIISGCNENSALNNQGGSGQGTLALYLMDAPIPGLKAVNVNITSVKISREVTPEEQEASESGWLTLNTTPMSVNLLDLRFDEALLGTSQLPIGTYRQLRLIIQKDATVVYEENGVEKTASLTIPSGSKSGLKINLNGLVIKADERTELIMDVNLGEFIHFAPGKSYMMRPTAIKVASRITTGKIQGLINDNTGAGITNTDILVNVIQNDAVVSTTYALKELGPKGEPIGSFSLNLLEAGTYTLEIVADGYETLTVPNVVVTAGKIIQVDGDPSTEAKDPILLTPISTPISTPIPSPEPTVE